MLKSPYILPANLREPQKSPGKQFPNSDIPTADFLRNLSELFARSQQFLTQPFLANATNAVEIRPQEFRGYVLIVNQSAANQLLIGFGAAPGFTGLTPLNGLLINAGGSYEPLAVPSNSIWVVGSAANTPGYIVYTKLR